MDGIIYYGFGKDYLKHWGIQQALREIYQNFLDFGDYVEYIINEKNNTVTVTVKNGYKPETLEFLRVGNSNKNGNLNAIGKHGEGMKMAFLILTRLGFKSSINTQKYMIIPDFYIDAEIGECFCFRYYPYDSQIYESDEESFAIQFTCNIDDYNDFKSKILNKDTEIIFKDDYHGSIINKPKGEIYVGNLYVCFLENFKNAYNFPPQRIPLDRDRELPRTFDVNYHASKIIEAFGKFNAVDTTYNDFEYVERIPETMLESITPKIVGNQIEFITECEEGKTVVISNPSFKNRLKVHNYFKDFINKLKLSLIKNLGLYDLLLEFKTKYVHSGTEMEEDFNIILTKVNK